MEAILITLAIIVLVGLLWLASKNETVQQYVPIVGVVLGILVGLWYFLTRKDPPDKLPAADPEPVEPEKFDDEPERILDTTADDLDLDSLAADRASDREPSIDELRADLDDV